MAIRRYAKYTPKHNKHQIIVSSVLQKRMRGRIIRFVVQLNVFIWKTRRTNLYSVVDNDYVRNIDSAGLSRELSFCMRDRFFPSETR